MKKFIELIATHCQRQIRHLIAHQRWNHELPNKQYQLLLISWYLMWLWPKEIPLHCHCLKHLQIPKLEMPVYELLAFFLLICLSTFDSELIVIHKNLAE